MSAPVPRELLLVMAESDNGNVLVTFDLGEPWGLDVPAEWFTYGLAVTGADGVLLKHFGVRISPTETKAFVFDFPSTTQANYSASHVQGRGTSLVVRFTDATLGAGAEGSFTGFATVEGEDVAIDVPAQLLP